MDARKLHFADFPRLIKEAIYEKFTYEQFVTFEECSKISHSFCQNNSRKKFPFIASTVYIKDYNITIFKGRIINIDEIGDIRKVFFPATFLNLSGEPTVEACDFIRDFVKGITSITLDLKTITPHVSEIIQAQSHIEALLLHVCDRHLSFDYSYVDHLKVFRAWYPLNIETIFSARARKMVSFQSCEVPCAEIINKIKLWKSGKTQIYICFQFAFRHKGYITVEIESFIEAMGEEQKLANTSDLQEWQVKSPFDQKTMLMVRVEKCGDNSYLTIEPRDV